MTSFGHSKPCQKTMYIYASLSLIISLIKLMSVNYAYNNKKYPTPTFIKRTGWLTDPPGAGNPLQGPQSAPLDDTSRHFAMFGWPNDLEIQQNKVRHVRIEDSF